MSNRTRKLTFLGIMLALSAVLSFIPIPGYPTTSFDSLPGYFVAIFINPLYGGIVALLGHVVTAFIHGMPLSIIGHIIVSISMFIAAYSFGFIFRKGNAFFIIMAVVIAALLNIYSSMPFLAWILKTPWPFLLSLQVPLLVASTANIVLAILVYLSLKNISFSIE